MSLGVILVMINFGGVFRLQILETGGLDLDQTTFIMAR
jgi:hypothetical protein